MEECCVCYNPLESSLINCPNLPQPTHTAHRLQYAVNIGVNRRQNLLHIGLRDTRVGRCSGGY